jgi:DNA-binding CsgD family transcriptional regulator
MVGREHELASVKRFLGVARESFAVLVLEGHAGIGKTTVWRAGTRRAAGDGFLVLSCRPAQTESKLSFVALTDLLRDVDDEAFESLPEPQRVALSAAILRSGVGPRSPSPRAVGAGLTSLLRILAGAAPLLIAVDDTQWLDRASAAALSYALRRLEGESVGALMSLRTGDGEDSAPLALGDLAPENVTRVVVRPLAASSLYHVIHDELGHVFPRPTLQRIEREAAGNPFFALELARALAAASAAPGPGDPLPVPDTIAALVRDRIAMLPAETRELLLAASLLSTARSSHLRVVVDEHFAESLASAASHGILVLRGDLLSFSHPLFASAVRGAATADERRAMHRRLAELDLDIEERARHLALGANAPDEKTARILDEAADRTIARAAPEAAAELAELAARLTPADNPELRRRRTLRAAGFRFRAGDAAGAERTLDALLAELPPGHVRAEAYELLARIHNVAGTSGTTVALYERALREAADDTKLAARLHSQIWLASFDDFERAERHAEAALALFDSMADPDPEVETQALNVRVALAVHRFQPLPMELVQRGLELEPLLDEPNVRDRISASLGPWLKYTGDFDGARYWLERTVQAAIDEGDEGALPYAVSHIAQLELWAGNWDVAQRRAHEHLAAAQQTGQQFELRQARFIIAYVDAHRGRLDEAEALAERVLVDATEHDDLWNLANAHAVLGLVALTRGDLERCVEVLTRYVEILRQIHRRAPVTQHGDLVEALVRAGDLERARSEAEAFIRSAETAGRIPWLAIAGRCRAQLAVAEGDLEQGASAVEAALAYHRRTTVPFDLARTLLVAAEVERRQGRRRAARDTLQRAQSIFAELGAPQWAGRAEVEIARLPIRHGRPNELTATERSVAQLAADGKTNREIALELHISQKTVEANLSRAYRKLEIRRRAQLGARLGAEREGTAAKT